MYWYLPDTPSCVRDSAVTHTAGALLGGTRKEHLNECSLDLKKKSKFYDDK